MANEIESQAVETSWKVTAETLRLVNMECAETGLTPAALADQTFAAYKANRHAPTYIGNSSEISVNWPNHPEWHQMLDEILNSGVRVCVDAIVSNLEAYSTAARALKAPKDLIDRRRLDRRKSDRTPTR
jgi:hypothetical protein